MAAVFALASALSFGTADFLGGLIAKRASALTVTMLSQLAGLIVLAPALAMLAGAPTGAALTWGAVAGLGGGAGLVLYLRALAIGPMGVVAPLAAVVGAAVPVGVGVGLGERPGTLAIVGIAFGLVAVVLATSGAQETTTAAATGNAGVALSLLAGGAFGLFFVALDASPATSGAWPLLAARATSLALLGGLTASRRAAPPRGRDLGWVPLSGALDMLANLLFLVATRAGMLAVVAVLTSLYPVVVMLLARQVLAERLSAVRKGGLVLAVAGTALIVAT